MTATAEQLTVGGGTRLTAELVDEYFKSGVWLGEPLGRLLDDAAEQWPAAVAATTLGPDGTATRTLSYIELRAAADRLAAGLSTLGVEPGQAVSVMLSNRVEFTISAFAVARLGGIFTGIPVTYGPREAAFMLRRAKSKALIVVGHYRSRDLVAFARELRAEAPELEHVIVLDGTVPAEPGWHDFAELAVTEPVQLEEVSSTALVHLGFTSGTTGEPKAVMNNHETIANFLRAFQRHIGEEVFRPGFVNLVISPVGHGTGFYWGALFTVLAGGTAAYLENWDAASAVTAIKQSAANVLIGSPTFLLDIMRQPGADPDNLPSLRMICIPGAPIPRPLVTVAREQLDCLICPAWGMTEWGIGISGSPSLPLERVEATDGRAVGQCEIRVTDYDDSEVGPGVEGNLQIRGPGLFLGYYDRPDFTADAFVDGWFRTGDRASIDTDGWVTLRGRTKDIIIRGGENIPVVDVENLSYEHPLVEEVAVVGIPDARLGERACAVVKIRDGEQLGLEQLTEFLLSRGISKRFLPEQLEVVDELPKTASGKIRKLELRQRFATDGARP